MGTGWSGQMLDENVCIDCGLVNNGEHDCEDMLTYALQAQGPDEYPESFYRYLARKALGVEDMGG